MSDRTMEILPLPTCCPPTDLLVGKPITNECTLLGRMGIVVTTHLTARKESSVLAAVHAVVGPLA